MSQVGYLAIALTDPSCLINAGAPGAQSPRRWSADGSASASDAIDQRNRAIAARLRERMPGLALARDRLADLDDLVDDDLSQEAVLRRYHRSRVLVGPWRGGELCVRIYDDLIAVTIPVVDPVRRERPALMRDLHALLDTLTETTGMVPWDPATGAPLTATAATQALLERHGPGLERLSRAVIRERLRRHLGLPSLVVLTLLAWVLSGWFAWDGVRRGTLMAGVDGDATATFVTDTLLPPANLLGFFPRFALEGHLVGRAQRVRLPVDRPEYLRAGPNAPYTVLPTADPQTPYVLRSAYESAQPLLLLGPLGIAWQGWLALIPLALWYGWILRPLWRAAPEQRSARLAEVTGKLLVVVQIAALLAVLVWLKRL